MRRLTVVQLVPAMASGGVERSTLEIAQALVAAGHRSVVVSAGGRLVPALEAAGSEHVTMAIGRKSPATLARVVSLDRLFSRLQPDIVHARSRLPAWLGYLALRLRRRPGTHFLTSMHGLNSPGWYSSIMTRGERVICVSETVRAHLLRQWPATDPDKLLVIEPGIDTAVFSAQADSVATDPAQVASPVPPNDRAEKLLLMPGRGARLKGHDAAIRLLADLQSSGVAARLWLLGAREPGRDAYVAQLEALARSLGVADRLQIDPPTADIVAAYRRCDLVLQLSNKPEAFGRTVVEALAVGRPVVGWSHGGVGELLARHLPEGRVEPGNQPALLATTLRMLDHPRLTPGSFPQTLARMQAQTLKVYESIAG